LQVATTIAETRQHVAHARGQGKTIALVPTMGALHRGHAALIDSAAAKCSYTVVSVFVNPIQFDRREDYLRYARSLDSDLSTAERHGAALVFAPPVEEMYPREQDVYVDVPGVSQHLCGAFRPGHFRGVATVVAKLFHIVTPDIALFGEKDAQQLAVVRSLATALNFPLEIVAVPTVREPDGLALSSRNGRLSPQERALAPLLYRALCASLEKLRNGIRDANALRTAGLQLLAREPALRVEYFEIVDSETIKPVDQVRAPVLIATAGWLGATRLIDNVRWP
jgi:pantoate--beta-alanine ligase